MHNNTHIVRGFTLIEILIVVMILSMLITIGSVSYAEFNKQARDSRRKADIESLRAALEMYRSNESVYPPNLNALIAPKKYLNKVPQDPNNPTGYTYTCTPNPTDCQEYEICVDLEATPTNYCVTYQGEK